MDVPRENRPQTRFRSWPKPHHALSSTSLPSKPCCFANLAILRTQPTDVMDVRFKHKQNANMYTPCVHNCYLIHPTLPGRQRVAAPSVLWLQEIRSSTITESTLLWPAGPQIQAGSDNAPMDANLIWTLWCWRLTTTMTTSSSSSSETKTVRQQLLRMPCRRRLSVQCTHELNLYRNRIY